MCKLSGIVKRKASGVMMWYGGALCHGIICDVADVCEEAACDDGNGDKLMLCLTLHMTSYEHRSVAIVCGQ